jgi:Fe-S-cluster containining protein
MTTSSDFKSIERAFYSDGFKLGNKAVENLRSGGNLFDTIHEMYELIDAMINSFSEFAVQQNQKIDCKKGCSWCCHQPVFALDYELDYLKFHINNKFSTEEQKNISKKATEKWEKLKGLKDEELINSKIPCPLLKNDSCTVYEVRPVACRIYLSKNVNTCVLFYNEPENKASYPDLLDLPMRIGRMINEGFNAALKTNGITPKEFRIEEKLL